MLRIATYTRISTDETHQPYSLEAQDVRLRNYIATQPDWALARTFTNQISGAKLDRAGLDRALVEARAGGSTCCGSTALTGSPAQCAAWHKCSTNWTRLESRSARPLSRSTPQARPGG
ncbi:MAG TPA: recombinase family protein [Mycobacteriales bacterium]|nr:recombinase family protein [Mycobacteriales bacterium]